MADEQISVDRALELLHGVGVEGKVVWKASHHACFLHIMVEVEDEIGKADAIFRVFEIYDGVIVEDESDESFADVLAMFSQAKQPHLTLVK